MSDTKLKKKLREMLSDDAKLDVLRKYYTFRTLFVKNLYFFR